VKPDSSKRRIFDVMIVLEERIAWGSGGQLLAP